MTSTAAAVDLTHLPAPEGSFASDTTAPARPEVIDALGRANVGHTVSYGADPLSERVRDRLRELAGDASAHVMLCSTGTGANVLAVAQAVDRLGTDRLGTDRLGTDRLVLAEQSHIAQDEEGGPQRMSGAAEVLLPAAGGRLDPDDVARALPAGPAVVCLTQATEDGTVYALEELHELVEVTHRGGGLAVLDGARLAHALVHAGTELAEVWATGLDAMVVGGTKAGMVGAEAVLARAGDPAWWRRSGQLPAKTRYVAAQWDACLDGLWLDTAARANAAARALAAGLSGLGVVPVHPVDINMIFLDLPVPAAEALCAWAPLSAWDRPGRVRAVASWDTTEQDIARLVAGVHAVC